MDPEVVRRAFSALSRLSDKQLAILLNMTWLAPIDKPKYFGNAIASELALYGRMK